MTIIAMELACVNCGKITSNAVGSLKYPYCKKCFKEVWNNNYQKYFKWLRS